MTLTEKLPKVRQFLLKHIAFCETKVTAGPWGIGHRTNRVICGAFDKEKRSRAVVDCLFTHSNSANASCPSGPESGHNATFIALSRTLDPLMAKGLVLMIGWVNEQHRDTVTETETGMHRCHNVSKCPACVFLQSLCDLFPNEMLTKL